jgi:hypothetical protein
MRQEEQTKDPCSPLDDYTSFISECSVVIEPYKQKLTSWLQKYRERLKSHYKSANSDAEKIARSDANGYRLINGYRVREIFSGEESLTSLLTRYFERKVSVMY